MSGSFGDGPRFRGDLSDHLGRRDEELPPDRWADRLRHAWLAYLLVTVALTSWVGVMAALVAYLGTKGWFLAMLVAFFPVGVYARILYHRLLSGRDPNTGERWKPPDR